MLQIKKILITIFIFLLTIILAELTFIFIFLKLPKNNDKTCNINTFDKKISLDIDSNLRILRSWSTFVEGDLYIVNEGTIKKIDFKDRIEIQIIGKDNHTYPFSFKKTEVINKKNNLDSLKQNDKIRIILRWNLKLDKFKAEILKID